jgi:hypothetical protein
MSHYRTRDRDNIYNRECYWHLDALLGRTQMNKKSASKPKLTDAERHKRFVEMAKEVGTSDDPKDFDKAFKKVATAKKSPTARQS